MSWIDARHGPQRLGGATTRSVDRPHVRGLPATLAPEFAGRGEDATEEKHPGAHPRHAADGAVQQDRAIVLTTGNKSEMAVGYCTLYGDMAGGFAVIKDVAKTTGLPAGPLAATPTIATARAQVIPERIITRAAERRTAPDQKDQDSLPPYEVLDAILPNATWRMTSSHRDPWRPVSRADVEKVTRLIKATSTSAARRRWHPVTHRVSAAIGAIPSPKFRA